MDHNEKVKIILDAKNCPYDRVKLLRRVLDSPTLSGGEAKWLSDHGIVDDRILAALEIQSPEARHAEFLQLTGAYDLTNKSVAKILKKEPQTISRYRVGAAEIPPRDLILLRKIIAAIDSMVK